MWVIAVTTALLNLVVMGLTFSRLSGMLGTSRIAFSVPVDAALIVSLILIPTAALFSAIALALSSFATSYKEGQHYMSPLFLVATPLAMVGLLPNVEIGYSLALVPVANIVLLVKGMLLGTGGGWGPRSSRSPRWSSTRSWPSASRWGCSSGRACSSGQGRAAGSMPAP